MHGCAFGEPCWHWLRPFSTYKLGELASVLRRWRQQSLKAPGVICFYIKAIANLADTFIGINQAWRIANDQTQQSGIVS